MSEIVMNYKSHAKRVTFTKPKVVHKVGYIVSRFPKLTETFVLQEILEMEHLGVAVEIYPLLHHQETVMQPEVGRLVKSAHFLPFFSLAILSAHCYFLWHHPVAYFQALFEIIKGTFGSLTYLAGALIYFPKAVQFAYMAKQQEVRHIHAQFANHPALVALVMHRLTNIPFSFTARGSDIHVDRTMLREKITAAEFAITVSAYNKEVMSQECRAREQQKIHVIYGGINTERFRPQPSHDTTGTLRILCVSRFEEVKGHRQLITACHLLQQRGVKFECHLVGDGELRPQIEEQIATYGLQQVITLHGACTQEQVIEQLGLATVFVLATVQATNGKREGIPNVLKEAMACELPVVASNISGIPELVEHGISGILVPPNDPAQLADALQQLQSDLPFCRQLGQAARQKILNDYDIKSSTRKRANLFFYSNL